MNLFPDITARDLRQEMMDDPALDEAEHARALRGLRFLNRISGTAAALWRSIRPLAAAPGHGAVRVLDIATGSGDIPLMLARMAHRDGLSLSIEACDASERAVRIAELNASKAGETVRFFRLDAVQDRIPGEYDVVMCSLFLHHLEAEHVVEVLYKMRSAARRLLLVSDLNRTRAGYLLAWAATRLFTRSPVVRTDALLSVRAAFEIEEMELLAEEAGLRGAKIRPSWPCRFQLEWTRE